MATGMLWLLLAMPLAGFLGLALAGGKLPRRAVAAVGTGSVGLACLLSLMVAAGFDETSAPYRETLWTWMSVDGLDARIGVHLDALSLIMTLVVTTVGFLIHVYSIEFMAGDEGYARFFAYLNLFVASMLILLLADNLLLLYLGWEGVGLSSYLLIGFWYREPANGLAARKAFIVTRVGDTALAIGLFLLFTELGTIDLATIAERAQASWEPGSGIAVAAAALVLAGAVGKSAQLPLQVWLPDAMAGPTPVSALIHAATMVTAGVYLIARTHVLFILAPSVLGLVAAIGAVTLLLAAASALAERDIKRVLAYSTISQIGYMFLALGVGAWAAAIFHFFTHAFFKALLFLGAGVVILSSHEEHDIYELGGLRRRLPVTFWTFTIGAASLSGLPLVTAGFYSKDWILWEAWSSASGGFWLAAAGLLGAFLTAVYSFRVVFLVFFGDESKPAERRPGLALTIPLVVLGFSSIVAGFLELPPTLGGFAWFSEFLASALPATEVEHASRTAELLLQLVAAGLVLAGIALSYWLFLARPEAASRFLRRLEPLRRAAEAGFGFDSFYRLFFARPFVSLAEVARSDPVDGLYRGVAWASNSFHQALGRTENGRLRWYAAVLAAGTVVFTAVAILT